LTFAFISRTSKEVRLDSFCLILSRNGKVFEEEKEVCLMLITATYEPAYVFLICCYMNGVSRSKSLSFQLNDFQRKEKCENKKGNYKLRYSISHQNLSHIKFIFRSLTFQLSIHGHKMFPWNANGLFKSYLSAHKQVDWMTVESKEGKKLKWNSKRVMQM
jgi:hypothetical protein